MANLDIGFQTMKYLLCVVNSLLLVVGLMLFIFGSAMHAIFNNFTRYLAPSFVSPATIVIFVGFFIRVVALLGCYGTIRENASIIYTFAVLLSLFLIIETATIILIYVLRDDVKIALTNKINNTIPEYESNIDAKFAIDFLHSTLECCGSNSFEDWSSVINDTINGHDVPRSCCVDTDLNPKYLLLVENKKKSPQIRIENRLIDYDACGYIYKTGCVDTLFGMIYQRSFYICFVTIGFLFAQITIISFMFVLARAIRMREKGNATKHLKSPIFSNFEWLNKPIQSQSFDSQLENLNYLVNT